MSMMIVAVGAFRRKITNIVVNTTTTTTTTTTTIGCHIRRYSQSTTSNNNNSTTIPTFSNHHHHHHKHHAHNIIHKQVYERASYNAAMFDHQYRNVLLEPPSSLGNHNGWRQRQMSITKLNPMRPYPTTSRATMMLSAPTTTTTTTTTPTMMTSTTSYPASFYPPYAHSGIVPYSLHGHAPDEIYLHDASSITRMKQSAVLSRQLLDYIVHPCISHPGRTTDSINTLLHIAATINHGVYPSPLNYSGFPKSVCTSVNEVICHGIPDSRPLQLGDILSCDVSVYCNGVHGDNCGSIVVGDIESSVLEKMRIMMEEEEEEESGGKNSSTSKESSSSSPLVQDLSWDGYIKWKEKIITSSSSSSLSSILTTSNPRRISNESVSSSEEYHDDSTTTSSSSSSSSSYNTSSTSSSPSSSTSSPSTKRDWPTLSSLPQKTTFATHDEEERIITARRLVQAALECRDAGVAACRPGGCLSDIGTAIHAVADAYGYDTVRHYRGHGICSEFHCAPFVKHFRNSDTLELVPGMIFTIEPMITEGNAECMEWSDNWTVVTMDGGRAAQFEHTVLITEEGVEVLTLPSLM